MLLTSARPELLSSTIDEARSFERLSKILLSDIELRDGKFSKSELAKPVEKPELTDEDKADYLEHLIEGTGKTKSFAELIANINKPIGGNS